MNEDFVIDDERVNLKGLTQGGSQIGGGAGTIGASGEDTLATNLASSIALTPEEDIKKKTANVFLNVVQEQVRNSMGPKCDTPIDLGE